MSANNNVQVRPAQAAVQGKGEWARVRLTADGVTIEAGGQRTVVPMAELINRFAAEHPTVEISRPDAPTGPT